MSMFERFTDRARKVMAIANAEAQRYRHESVSPDHVMLGIVREGSGVACNVLRNLGHDPVKVRMRIESELRSGPEPATMGKLPLTPFTEEVLYQAKVASAELRHNYIGTEHILIGLVRSHREIAKRLGMDDSAIFAEAKRLTADSSLGTPDAEPSDLVITLTIHVQGGRLG
jgi:ATP-dependent Clp protease ATP-binding subunit ClpC